jgi:hypothetical protein
MNILTRDVVARSRLPAQRLDPRDVGEVAAVVRVVIGERA